VHCFSSMPRPPPSSTLFPYTTLFRSHHRGTRYGRNDGGRGRGQRGGLGHRLNAGGRDIELRERGRIVLVFRLRLEDHAVLVGLRSEEHTSELQSRFDLVCRLLLEKKK